MKLCKLKSKYSTDGADNLKSAYSIISRVINKKMNHNHLNKCDDKQRYIRDAMIERLKDIVIWSSPATYAFGKKINSLAHDAYVQYIAN